jgi:methionine synthase II (cobalamin-independent)
MSMTTHVHFVGSIGLDSTAEVFDAVGATVKSLVRRCPDGEVGGRRLWNSYQWPVLRATSFLEAATDTAFPGVGLCPMRLKTGARPEEIHFGELGYAREARISYQDFLAARQRGAIAAGTRFQVCLPTPLAVMVFIIPSDVPQVLPAYEQAMIREVEKICAAIPHADLALQWDVCMEMIQWDGRAPGMAPFPGMEQAFAGAFARICAPVPADVELGIHLCYGDMDAKHFIQPQDLGKAVELANLISASVAHPLAWIHMPVPADRADRAYYEPLRKLKRGARTELYLGLVHTDDGVAGTVQRMRAAHEFVSDFGIATECGISRARTPEKVRALLQLHAAAARAYAGAS